MNFNKRFYALAFLMMLSIALTVVADEEAEDVVQLEDIVVTARKREQRSFEVPLSVSTLQGEKFDTIRSSGMDVRFFVEPHAEFTDRIVVWTYLSALLYSRSWQYGLRPQRFAAGFAALRRRCARKRLAKGISCL